MDMLQNVIASLSRNPAALRALAELIAPTLRNLVRQQTDDDLAQMRRRVDALANAVAQDLPAAIAKIDSTQQATAVELAALRRQWQEASERQRQETAALRTELEALRLELKAAQDVARQAAEAAGVAPGGRRWWPW